MILPPPSAWLDSRWNACLDLAAKVPVSPAEVAAAWERNGPERALAALRKMAAGGDEITEEAASA